MKLGDATDSSSSSQGTGKIQLPRNTTSLPWTTLLEPATPGTTSHRMEGQNQLRGPVKMS